jgi:hypothetical protein
MSLAHAFPFGGVRQTLFLSPFVLAFTGLGLYALRANRLTQAVGSVAAIVYLALWAYYLPRFYNERTTPYTARDIVETWGQNGKPPVYARGGNERELDYTLRNAPEIRFHSLAKETRPPFLLIVTHYPIDDPVWFEGYPEYLEKSGYKAELVMERPMRHLASREYSTSLYFPPNGLRIYKVTGP